MSHFEGVVNHNHYHNHAESGKLLASRNHCLAVTDGGRPLEDEYTSNRGRVEWKNGEGVADIAD